LKDPHLKEDRAQITYKLMEYFREERDEEIGELAAGMLLDFIEREIGPVFYNRGVRDAKSKAITVLSTLTEELDFLEQLVPKKPAKGK
jgi:uncharacterized protein (DUF2164 family)